MYLIVREAADRLRISPSSVYLLIEQGRLAHHRYRARRGASSASARLISPPIWQCAGRS